MIEIFIFGLSMLSQQRIAAKHHRPNKIPYDKTYYRLSKYHYCKSNVNEMLWWTIDYNIFISVKI